MMIASALAMLTMMFAAIVVAYLVLGLITVRFGRWAKSYNKLAKTVTMAKVFYPLGKPRMTFNYGDNFCVLKNTTSRYKAKRQTQLIAKWPDRRLKLLISSINDPSRFTRTRNLQRINIESDKPGDHFSVFTNQVEGRPTT